MKIRTNIYGIRQNPALLTFLTTYRTFFVPSTGVPDRVQAVEYDFAKFDHESLITADELAMLLAVPSNIWINGANIYTTKVLDAKLDQSVPVDFPNSTIDDGGTIRQCTWREYSQHFPIVDGYMIKWTKRRDANNNAEPAGDALMRLYLREFPSYKTKAAAQIKLDEYAATQQ